MKKYVFGIIAVMLIIACVVGYVLYPKTAAATVCASGTGKIDVKPDWVIVNTEIITYDAVSEQAGKTNTQQAKDLIDALLAAGLTKDDIETTSFFVSEYSTWKNSSYVKEGYRAITSFKLTIKDYNDIVDYLSVIINSNGTVSYMNYELSPDRLSQKKQESLRKASLNAKGNAQALLDGVGQKLGKLVSISTDYNYYPYPIYRAGMDVTIDSSNVKSYELPPRDVEVSATVTVVYEIV
jgi:uncharacterized protein